jgi:hypothetical protein
LREVAQHIIGQLPKPFLLEEAKEKLLNSEQQPFNIYVLQEMHRYNTLLNCIINTLEDVIQAAKGMLQ